MKFSKLFLSVVILSSVLFFSCKKKVAQMSLNDSNSAYISGDTFDFGTITKGAISANDKTIDFVLSSNGTKKLAVSSLKLEGTNADMYKLTTDFTSGDIEAEKSIKFSITLLSAVIGSPTANITIVSDAKDSPNFVLNLTGTVQ